jgi:hypothetical protein
MTPRSVNKDPTQHDDIKDREERIVEEAKSRYNLCLEYGSTIYDDIRDDNKFLAGDQWDPVIRQKRENDARPTFTINRLNPVVNAVKNDLIQNSPEIKVRPIDTKDAATANVINGMIRHICKNLDGKSAIDWALTCACRSGVGYLRVKTQHTSDSGMDAESFNQEICLERIEDPLLCHFPIPLCKAQDYSDAPYAIVRILMGKRTFQAKYPDAWEDLKQWQQNKSEEVSQWVTDEAVWLCEYFVVEHNRKKIILLSDGSVMTGEEKDLVTGKPIIKNLPEGLHVVNERWVDIRKVKRYLLTAVSILEEHDIPSKSIPIVPIFGDELIASGQKRYISVIRYAKDIQMLYNYWKSKEGEMISLAPKAPFMAAFGQLDKFLDDWKSSNVKNTTVLQYNPICYEDGTPVPPPQRLQPPSLDAASITAAKECIDDIKACTAIYDPALGGQSNEVSGRAIIARQKQSSIANSHFYESLLRAMRFIGRLCVEMIPHYYDSIRVVRIVGSDETDDVVKLNEMYHDDKTGEQVLYDVTKVSNYAVEVQTGVSYETRRTETAQNIIALVQSNPALWNTLGDILIQNLDWDGSDKAARRIRATIPPNILAADKDEIYDQTTVQKMKIQLADLMKKSQSDDQVKQQMDQVIQALTAKEESKTNELMNKVHVAGVKADAEIQKANMQLQATKIKTDADAMRHTVDSAITFHKAIPEVQIVPDQSGLSTGSSTIG